ncbi:MAG: S8 family serine peptidase [Bacteriovoracaceae bacterium]|nr:S8 family serine peptidase [Bacteriovoracaceae bacterium]
MIETTLTLYDSLLIGYFMVKNYIFSILFIATSLQSVSYADSFKRKKKVSKPRLLHKVLKKKAAKKLIQNEESDEVLDSPLNPNLLKSKYTSWGIDPSNNNSSINLTKAWQKFKNNKQVVVAVIDTGIDPKHPHLDKNVHVTLGDVSFRNYGIDFSKNRYNKKQPSDSHGHGTHVAGIVKSVYPEVKILTLKYYNPKATGQDNLNSTISALKYAVDQNVDVINYSGGGPEPALEELRVLKLAEKKGILVVAAAGNEESDIDVKNNAYYPASYGLKNIITVTAHDQGLKMLNSSNYGKRTVDLSAPGYRIKSSLPNGRSGYLTGTSQATAFVTGAAALLLAQFPELTATQLKAIINKSARKEITLLSRCKSGGRLDATRAQNLAREFSKRVKAQNRGVANRVPNSINKKLKNNKKVGKITYRKSQAN